jgi:hypothetical protein
VKPKTPPSDAPVVLAPPPWQLSGEGIIVLARTNEGTHGLMMFVQYAESGVGPYDEVLWIPLKRFLPPYSITAIRVSTQVSVEKGREYWGIPKRLAHFDWLADRAESRFVRTQGAPNEDLSITFEGRGFGPKLPIRTAWIPRALLTLEQLLDGRWFRFTPSAQGSIRFMKDVRLECRGAEFPVIEKAIAAVGVPRFAMTFPAAAISKS